MIIKHLKISILLLSLFLSSIAFGQSDSLYTQEYLVKSSSFAWLTYGGDLNVLSGGKTQNLDNGILKGLDFGPNFSPRLTIGGIHFWGHADFYVTFPLSFLTFQTVPSGLEELELSQGVETGMRLYPWKLQHKRLSPFLGISFRSIDFSQKSLIPNNENEVVNYGRFINPIEGGFTYTSAKWHISASSYYNFQNGFSYFISRTEQANVELDPISFNLSILRYVDLDGGLRRGGSADYMNRRYKKLKDEKLLSAWFFGIGPSSALQMSKSPLLENVFPYLSDDYSASILPDFAFGRYFHRPDANINLSYRFYGDRFEGYNSEIRINRHSVGIESVKFLFNYLGFVPFAGPIVSYENLRTRVDGKDYREEKFALGFTFGWDIRVTETGSSLLRTNLRYYPDLHMKVENHKMMFDHLEFNFIQWVQFIGRNRAMKTL